MHTFVSVLQPRCRRVNGFGKRVDPPHQFFHILHNLLRRTRCAGRKISDLIRHDRKTLARFSGACSFNRSVQSEHSALACNLFYHIDDIINADRLFLKHSNLFVDRKNLFRGLIHDFHTFTHTGKAVLGSLDDPMSISLNILYRVLNILNRIFQFLTRTTHTTNGSRLGIYLFDHFLDTGTVADSPHGVIQAHNKIVVGF